MLNNIANSRWNDPAGQAVVGIAASLFVGTVIWFGGIPGILLLVVLAFCSPSFMILAFVCLSYFRIHEAYPLLVSVKLPLVFSAASIAVIAFVLFKMVRQSDARNSNWIILALFLTFLAADVIILGGLGKPGGALRLPVAVAMVLAAGAFYAWYRALNLMNTVPWGREIELFVGFFIIVTIGVAFAKEPSLSFKLWNEVYWKIGAMTLALAWLIRTEKEYRLTLWTLIGSGCLVALVTWHNWYYAIDLVEGTRVTVGRTLFSTADDIANAIPGLPVPGGSQLGDPNDLALVLLFPVGLALAALVKLGLRTPLGWLALISLPLLISAIVMTQSRGGALGVVAVFGVIGLFLIRSKLLIATLSIVGIIGLILVMDIQSRTSGGISEIGIDGIDRSSLERIHAWTAAISMTYNNPLTGVGIDNFVNEFHHHTPVWSGRNMAAHSTWFEIMAQTGLPGFGFFIAIIVSITFAMRRSWLVLQHHQADPILAVFCMGLLAALAGFCAAGTFLSQGLRWPLYLLIGFTAALSCTTRQLEQDSVTQPETADNHHGATQHGTP